jgi:LAO/AO transport system kinase
MKAGLMEIADVFVVNKSDRPDADVFVRNLRLMLAPAFATHKQEISIIKTIAHQHKGLDDLVAAILKHQQEDNFNEKKAWLLAEKAFQLIQKERMRDIDKSALMVEIKKQSTASGFNLYRFVQDY